MKKLRNALEKRIPYKTRGWKGGIVYFCNICDNAFLTEKGVQTHMILNHEHSVEEWSGLIFNPSRRDSGRWG